MAVLLIAVLALAAFFLKFQPALTIVSALTKTEEVACTSNFDKQWSERDSNGDPIWYDVIKITTSPDFASIDASRNIDKSRPNYLKLQIIANLKLLDGRSVKIMDNIFYGFEDGKFIPQQLYFTQKIDIESLDTFPLINCELGSV